MGNPRRSKKDQPLREIVGYVPHAGDRAILECGHEKTTSAIYRARCVKCRDEKPPEHLVEWMEGRRG